MRLHMNVTQPQSLAAVHTRLPARRAAPGTPARRPRGGRRAARGEADAKMVDR